MVKITFAESFHEDVAIQFFRHDSILNFGLDGVLAFKNSLYVTTEEILSNPVFPGIKRVIVNKMEFKAFPFFDFWVVYEDITISRNVVHLFRARQNIQWKK